MNVLIIGAKGQLGRELCDCFARGYTSIGVPEILKENNTLLLADIDEVDIADMDSLRRFTAQGEIDVIINCAAYTDVPGCESNQVLAMQANALGPRNLAILADELGAKLIHISTDYVFDGDATAPYAEWDIKNPQSRTSSRSGSAKYSNSAPELISCSALEYGRISVINLSTAITVSASSIPPITILPSIFLQT